MLPLLVLVKWILFYLALVLELFYILMFSLTIRFPVLHFWPPPGIRSWQFYTTWSIYWVVGFIFFILGPLDFSSAGAFNLYLRVFLALLLFGLGGWIDYQANQVISPRTKLGLRTQLVTSGIYSRSRNPIYLGDSLLALGYMVLTNTWMVWIIGFFGILLNLYAPFTEEPWLAEQYGQEYLDYRRRVPRFFRLGWRKRSE